MQLWIVGKPTSDKNTPDGSWEFQGVFDTRAKAVAACTGPSHFLFPATLNERLPEETIASPGTEFPNRPPQSPQPGKKPR